MCSLCYAVFLTGTFLLTSKCTQAEYVPPILVGTATCGILCSQARTDLTGTDPAWTAVLCRRRPFGRKFIFVIYDVAIGPQDFRMCRAKEAPPHSLSPSPGVNAWDFGGSRLERYSAITHRENYYQKFYVNF